MDQTLCDLWESINLMPLSMKKRLCCGEPKFTHMTLTLADRSITYSYGILEDVIVKVDGMVFSVDFVIMDMPEDAETLMILCR